MSKSKPILVQKVISSTLLSRKPRVQNQLVGWIIWMSLLLTSMIYWADLFGLKDWLTSTPLSVFQEHEYWRLLTATWIHADIGHFLSNSILYSILGFLILDYFGARILLALILIFGGVIQYLALRTYPDGVHLIGASGVVYLMGGFWVTLYFLVERRLGLRARTLRCLGFSLAVLFPSTFEPQVSYRTHAIGFGVGIVVGLIYFLINFQRIRSQEVWSEVVDEPDEELMDDEASSSDDFSNGGRSVHSLHDN